MDWLAIAATDPTVIPLWAAFLFAAAMYPVGMFFGCNSCCGVCKSCCRDAVGQVVVEYSLEGIGQQTVKETPFYALSASGGLPFIEGTANIPMFILTGDESGARVLVRAVNNNSGESRSPFMFPLVRMGNQYLTDFIDGESVTVTPTPDAELVEEPSLTAVVGECEFNPTLQIYQKPLSFTGNPGKWTPFDPPTPVNLTVDCQADEGTVVFDVADRDLKPPAFCDTCNIIVERLMPHPASFLLNPCSSGPNDLNDVHSFAAETSSLSVSVPLSVFGSTQCPDEITASGTTYWVGFGGSCLKTDLHTIARADQDCVPFESWPVDPADPPENYMEQLVRLSATACFGSGFAGIATEPTGGPGDSGPITAVAVTQPGEGYAIIGRVQPSVTITGTGSGADLEVSWEQTNDTCGRPRWRIESVTVGPGGGGTGYVDGEELTVTVDTPGTEEQPAVLVAVCGREEPTLVPDFPLGGGTGEELTLSLVPSTTYPNTWEVDEITVVDGGSGWTYGQFMSAVGATDDDITFTELNATIHTSVSEPTITFGGGSGSGADLSASYTSNGTTYGPETWSIASIAINDGGTGYQVNDVLTLDLAAGDVTLGSGYVTVSSVSGTGAITGLSIVNPGTYYHDSGVIASVVVDFAGAYYRISDVIASVTVTEQTHTGGLYYEEDATAPAIVSSITINVSQFLPSDGAGAEIEAVVDDDPESATFGQIIGLDIVDGGDNYIAVWVADGPCVQGGLYRAYPAYCGSSIGDPEQRGGLLLSRGCPDYTYSISIQGPAS